MSLETVRFQAQRAWLRKHLRTLMLRDIHNKHDLRLRLTHGLRPNGAIIRAYLRRHPEPLLHLGCGSHPLEGWLNTDYYPQALFAPHLDATKPFPLPDASVALAYSEHMIEHIPYAAGLAMLAECHRVLKPGGRLRVATPDLAFLEALRQPRLSRVQQDYIRWSALQYPGCPRPEALFVLNNFMRDWGHVFIYDEKALKEALVLAGFKRIQRCQLGRSTEPRLKGLENESRMPAGFLALETMVLEAQR